MCYFPFHVAQLIVPYTGHNGYVPAVGQAEIWMTKVGPRPVPQTHCVLSSEFVAYLGAAFSPFLGIGRPVSDRPSCLQRFYTWLHVSLLIGLWRLGGCYIWIVIRIHNSIFEARVMNPERKMRRERNGRSGVIPKTDSENRFIHPRN